MIRNPVKRIDRVQRPQSMNSIREVVNSSFGTMLQSTSRFAPEQERMSEDTNVPMFDNSINGMNLIMVKSEMLFHFSKDTFNFPSQVISLNNNFRVKNEVVGNIDVDFLGIIGISFANSDNDIIITFKTMNFGFKAMNTRGYIS